MNDTDRNDGNLRPSPLAAGLWTTTYPSGLRLIVQEDHRTPVAVANVWVGVGSNREPDALRGWSHGIEHMLFKGTARRSEGDFAREVAAAGGTTNAGTGYETTNYHVTVPAERIAVAVDILGDALFHSTFAPESLDAERQVLVHENHMYDDMPFGFGLTWRWALELACDVSPYRHPIGGRDENLLERSREQIVAFWRSAYRPENATVVVVGAVDPAAVAVLVADAFPTAARSGPAPVTDHAVAIVSEPPVEPRHAEPRCRVETGDIQKAYAKLVLPTPGERDPRRHALAVIRRVLGDGRSCRLYRRLVEERKLADDISVVTETGPREGVLVIDLESDPARIREAVAATLEVCADLARESCTPEELARAATRVLRGHLFASETVQGQAANLGYYDALGDLARAFNLPVEIAAVDRDDVADLARWIFRANDLTAVFYLPDGTDTAGARVPLDGAQLADLAVPILPDAVAPAGTANSRAAARPAVRAARTAAVPATFQLLALDGGTVVWHRHDPSVPVVSVSLLAPGGSTGEPADAAGLANLMQMTQLKGAGGLDDAALHAALEGEGAVVAPVSQRDYTGLNLSALTDRLDPVLDLLRLVVLAPTYADGEVEQERRLALEQLASLQDNPFQAAAVRLREAMYGDHPYGRPLPGTPSSLPRIDRAMISDRHAEVWTRARLQIVVSGDIGAQELGTRLERLLDGMPQGQPVPDPVLPPAREPSGVARIRVKRRQNQAVVLVGWPGPHSANERRVPLMLMREALNGQSGRLFEALRNRRSLCYNTGILGTAGFGQGMLAAYVLTAPDTADAARDALVAEVSRLADTPVGADEFTRVRDRLLGNLLIAVQANAARAARAARARIYARGPDDLQDLVAAIRACTPDEVLEAAATYVSPTARYDVVLGP